MTQNIPTISDEAFSEEILNNGQHVMVAFTTKWCGLCHIMEAIIDRIAAQFSDRIKFCQIDTEFNPIVKDRYGIHDLPTLLIFYKGEIVAHSVGALSQDELLAMLNSVLNDD